MAQLLADDLEFIAPAPGPVLGTSVQIFGPQGNSTYYYWWVTFFPIGATVTGPIMITHAPDPASFSTTNFVIVNGTPSLGATSYTLLRTDTPVFPSAPGNFVVFNGLSTPSAFDQRTVLGPFSPSGLPFGAPVSAHINLNNRDYSQPTLVVAPFQLAVTQLIFPDGSMQSTAPGTPGGGITGPASTTIGNVPTWASNIGTQLGPGYPARITSLPSPGSIPVSNASGQLDISWTPQIYSWQFGVNANGNSLSGASSVGTASLSVTGNATISGTLSGITTLTTSNITVSGTLSAPNNVTFSGSLQIGTTTGANANSWKMQSALTGVPTTQFAIAQGTTNTNAFIISRPDLNVILGTGTTVNVDTINLKPARLQIYMPTTAPDPTIPMIYAFNNLGDAVAVIDSFIGNAILSLRSENVAIPANFALSVTSLGAFTLSNLITGSGLLLITGPGQFIFSGINNSFSGNVAIGTAPPGAFQLLLSQDSAAKPTTNTWTISSDIRTKRNIRPLEGGLDVIRQIEPIEAEYNGCAQTPEGSRVVSFDPDKLVKVLPGCVSKVRAKLREEDEEETDIGCVNTHEIMHHLVLAVQQLERMVTSGQTEGKKGRRN
jgi:hypothetical protein